MKIRKPILLALLLTYASSMTPTISAQDAANTVATTHQLNLMPVPASVQLQPGRLPISGAFSVATKGYSDDRLQSGIYRIVKRLQGRIGLTLPTGLATDESAAALVVQSGGPGQAIPSVADNESYSLEVSDKQARLVAPTVVGALRGLETLLQLVESDRDG